MVIVNSGNINPIDVRSQVRQYVHVLVYIILGALVTAITAVHIVIVRSTFNTLLLLKDVLVDW